MSKTRKTWVYSPPSSAKPKPPESVKASVAQKANELVERVLKPRYIQPPPPDAQFNYIVDIYTKWHGNYFYFCANYAVPGPYALAPFFEAKFARLEYAGADCFNLSYMRYTDEWFEVYLRLSLAQCLATIQDDALFEP